MPHPHGELEQGDVTVTVTVAVTATVAGRVPVSAAAPGPCVPPPPAHRFGADVVVGVPVAGPGHGHGRRRQLIEDGMQRGVHGVGGQATVGEPQHPQIDAELAGPGFAFRFATAPHLLRSNLARVRGRAVGDADDDVGGVVRGCIGGTGLAGPAARKEVRRLPRGARRHGRAEAENLVIGVRRHHDQTAGADGDGWRGDGAAPLLGRGHPDVVGGRQAAAVGDGHGAEPSANRSSPSHCSSRSAWHCRV